MRRALATAVLAAAAACSRPAGDAARAVREYDDVLVRAYRDGDTSGMARVASAKEAGRVRVLVDLKSAGKLVLESTLESFEVVRADVAPGGDRATVETRERWRYFDRHLRPGDAPGPTFVADMSMRYDLVREDGRFKVGGVTTLANTYVGPAPSGGAGAGHGHGAAGTAGAPRSGGGAE